MPAVIRPAGQRRSQLQERRRDAHDLPAPVSQREDVLPFAGRQGQPGIAGQDQGQVLERQGGLEPDPRQPARHSERFAQERPLDDATVLPALELAQLPGDPRLLRIHLHDLDAVAELPEEDLEVGREELLEEHGPLGRQPLLHLGPCPEDEATGKLSMSLKNSWKYWKGSVRSMTGPKGLRLSPSSVSGAVSRKVRAGWPLLWCSRMSNERSG